MITHIIQFKTIQRTVSKCNIEQQIHKQKAVVSTKTEHFMSSSMYNRVVVLHCATSYRFFYFSGCDILCSTTFVICHLDMHYAAVKIIYITLFFNPLRSLLSKVVLRIPREASLVVLVLLRLVSRVQYPESE